MSVYVLLRTVVPRLLRAKVDRHNWGPITSYSLWPPRLPGYSILYINYDHLSLIEASNCAVLVLNACGENRARLRRGGITVASCPSTEQLLDAGQLLAERLLAEQLLEAEHLSHRRLARTVVTNLESLLLRLAVKSSHVHITERVLYTEVQRKAPFVVRLLGFRACFEPVRHMLEFIFGQIFFRPFSQGKVHGLVDPLCGTSWDEWNWDKLHRGYRACPGTRKGLQRGDMTCPMARRGLFWPFPVPIGTSCACPTGTSCACTYLPVPLGQVVVVPVACPSGTSQVQAPPFQSQPLNKFRVIPYYQKPKGS